MFRFRLQRVLDLRLKKEQAVARELGEAQRAEELARQECDALQQARDTGALRAAEAQASSPSVGQLQNLRFVVERMNDHLEAAHQAHAAAEQTVQQRMVEFSAAFRDRRVLDRLRERDRTEWMAREAQADRQLMDDIALTRFVRTPSRTQATEEEK